MPPVYRVGFFDMDGTLIYENTWELIYRKLGVKGSGWLGSYLRGEISYAELMKRDIESWLSVRKRISLNELESMAHFVTVREDAKALINRLISKGITPVIVTAGLDVFAKKVAEELKIDEVFSNHLYVDKNNYITGDGYAAVEPLKKDILIKEYLRKHNIDPSESFSVGDTEYDASMFKVTGTGFLLINGIEINVNLSNVIKVRSLNQVADIILNHRL